MTVTRVLSVQYFHLDGGLPLGSLCVVGTSSIKFYSQFLTCILNPFAFK